MKGWQGILLGLFAGLLSAGLILVIAHAPRGDAVVLIPPPTPAPLVVHISGAVKQPGVYPLPVDSRVQDAVAAAGGLSETAQAEAVNLAEPVMDGEKIYIPAQGEILPTQSSRSATLPELSSGGERININIASLEELEALAGIGQTKARAIITYRETYGPFQKIEDIQNVPGIGEGIFETIKDQISIE